MVSLSMFQYIEEHQRENLKAQLVSLQEQAEVATLKSASLSGMST